LVQAQQPLTVVGVNGRGGVQTLGDPYEGVEVSEVEIWRGEAVETLQQLCYVP
jgi:hypothetical protein